MVFRKRDRSLAEKRTAMIVSMLRRVHDPLKTAVLQAARVGPALYICAACKKVERFKDEAGKGRFEIDHVEPVVPLEGFKPRANGMPDWNEVVARMFPDQVGYQLLHKEPCHREKSAKENDARRKIKAERKKASEAPNDQ